MTNYEVQVDDKEADAIIVTKSVAVKATCPYCGEVNEQDIGIFIEEYLWTGGEDMVCDECDRQFHIASVERDC